ncbi:MAG TPA: hypothetical protein VHH73_14150, partial [Verrucomicrobiae bacterium]|nr:hypothetical protein [Verrucomicrobiae bacterium]
PGGIMVQWVQAYESNNRAFATMVATFASVFPHVSIWYGGPGDLVLVGSVAPVKIDLAAVQRRFNEPGVHEDLARVNIKSFPLLLAQEVVPAKNGAYIPPPDTAIQSDYYPTIEFVAQRALFVREPANLWVGLDERIRPRAESLLAQYLQSHTLSDDDYWSFNDYYASTPLVPWRVLRSLYLRWQREKPESNEPLGLLTRMHDQPNWSQVFVPRFAPFTNRFLKLSRRVAEPAQRQMLAMMEAYRLERSVFHIPPAGDIEQYLRQLIETDPANQRTYRLELAELAWDRGDDEAALALGRMAFDPDVAKYGHFNFTLDPGEPAEVMERMVETLIRAGKREEAWLILAEAATNNLLGPRAAVPNPRLELEYRRLGDQLERTLALQGGNPGATNGVTGSLLKLMNQGASR